MSNMYLVTVFWTCRPIGRYYVEAKSENQAIMFAVEKRSIDSNELYDHMKSNAVLFGLTPQESE